MIKPLADKVVVEPLEEESKSPGGIILPDAAKKKPQEGIVVAVGPGKVLDDGSRGAMNVKKDDKVIFAKYGGTEVTIEGKDYVILDQDSHLRNRGVAAGFNRESAKIQNCKCIPPDSAGG